MIWAPRRRARGRALALGVLGVAGLLVGTAPLGALPHRVAAAITEVRIGGNPDRVAVGPSGVWVGDLGRLARLDPTTNQVTDVPGGTTPIGVGADSVWGGVYTRSDTVARIDPASARITATVDVADAPTSIAVGPTDAWVLASTGVLTRVDLATNSVTATLVLSGVRVGPAGSRDGGFGFAVVATASAVWVSGRDADDHPVLWRIDPASAQVVDTVPVGVDCTRLVSDGAVLWAGCGTAQRFDPASRRLVDSHADAGNGIAIGSGGVYALSAGGTLAQLDVTSGQVVASLAVPPGAETVAMGNRVLWLADPRLHDAASLPGTGTLLRVVLPGTPR